MGNHSRVLRFGCWAKSLERHIPEAIEDAVGRWGELMIEVIGPDEVEALSLRGDQVVVTRLVDAGLGTRLAVGLLSLRRMALADLLSDDEIYTQSWPNWNELRLRSARKSGRAEAMEEALSDSGVDGR